MGSSSFSSFIHVEVEEHDALPNGCSMRFHATGEPVAVHRVRYEAEDGRDGMWRVHAQGADGSATRAMAVSVDDSGAGSCTLIYAGERGEHGLRLTPEDGGEPIAEPYLLVSPDAVIA
ncbi:hypothetical protein [Pendulispora albinea]|uniref:Uncharacterized protein n=1 Tax=Pendulispora albinea TaxID=2741071 RepID=A0ABZ2M2L3_9BACT